MRHHNSVFHQLLKHLPWEDFERLVKAHRADAGVKQVLKIRRFLGTSKNAVCIQIAVALIAFLLLRLAQAGQTAIASPLAFARLVRANLMYRRPLDRLLDPNPPPSNTAQLALRWNLS